MEEKLRYDNRPIGVFDSGLGGLTVVSALRKSFPSEDIIYLGDTARVPYGTKSQESIFNFACEDANFLLNKGVKAIIAACNTVSTVALEQLKEQFPNIPIIGVLEAGVEAILNSNATKIAVIGTRATISSDAYRRKLHERNRSLIIQSIACPMFVPLAEEGINSGDIVYKVFDLYLSELKKNPPEVIFLGCTHYPVFTEALESYFSFETKIIDSAKACSLFTEMFLKENNIVASPDQIGSERFYLTDIPNNTRECSKRFLNFEMKSIEKANLLKNT